jgi:hypothetical protein
VRGSHALAYDSARGVIVLFGGHDIDGFNIWDDTWEWDGTDWTQRSPANKPRARTFHAMAYDSARGATVLFAGLYVPTSGAELDDTWEWDGTDWTDRTPVTHPSARSGHGLAYDGARGVTVLFGGYTNYHYLTDTWEWDGVHWTLRSPLTTPPARENCALAYDAARGVTVLFGGYYSSGGDHFLKDTWEWDGTDWTQRSPANSPPARSGHALAYDSVRGVLVLFGGLNLDANGDPHFLSDTWEWDGWDWTHRSPANHPLARAAHALAYDSVRAATVLFGGIDSSNSFLDDTWEWDGTDWIQRSPAHKPPARGGHALAYASAQGVTVLFGGYDSDENALDDTWEWNGTDWTDLTPANIPPARALHALAYDSARGVTVLFGGYAPYYYLDDTWEYSPFLPSPILAPIENPDGDGNYWLAWSTVPGATGYTVEEDDSPSFSSPMVLYQGDQDEFLVSAQGPGDWYYRVKGSSDDGESGWSNVEATGVRPEAPVLYPIENDDGNCAYLVDWGDVTGATTYRLEEDDDPGFGSAVIRYTGAGSQHQVVAPGVGTWYYRVLASNMGGDSPWSNTQSVVVSEAPATVYLPLVLRSFAPGR